MSLISANAVSFIDSELQPSRYESLNKNDYNRILWDSHTLIGNETFSIVGLENFDNSNAPYYYISITNQGNTSNEYSLSVFYNLGDDTYDTINRAYTLGAGESVNAYIFPTSTTDEFSISFNNLDCGWGNCTNPALLEYTLQVEKGVTITGLYVTIAEIIETIALINIGVWEIFYWLIITGLVVGFMAVIVGGLYKLYLFSDRYYKKRKY